MGPNMAWYGEAGSAFAVSDPTPLDTLTMRASGDWRRSGSIPWQTGRDTNTLVSQTARTSSRDALLACDDAAYSGEPRRRSVVFEMPALLTSRSRRPYSSRIRSARAAI